MPYGVSHSLKNGLLRLQEIIAIIAIIAIIVFFMAYLLTVMSSMLFTTSWKLP